MTILDIDEIKKRIKNKLNENKMSYTDLALKTNLSLGTIKDIMRGHTEKPRIDTINTILKALGINPEDDYKYIPSNTTEEEIELLNEFKKLPVAKQGEIAGYIKGLNEIEEYKKKHR